MRTEPFSGGCSHFILGTFRNANGQPSFSASRRKGGRHKAALAMWLMHLVYLIHAADLAGIVTTSST